MKRVFTMFICGLAFFVAQAQVQVTFRVDMTDESVSSAGVHVAGDFQNWSPNTTMLTDDDGDGIYETTLSLFAGPISYKYINGDAFGMNECGDGTSGCGDCGADDGFGGHNRQLTIPDVFGYATPAYKYNTCEVSLEAVSVIEPSSTIKGIQVAPNPFSFQTVLTLQRTGAEKHDLILTDVTGNVVRTMTNLADDVVVIERGDLAPGFYLAHLRNSAGEIATTRLTVQ